jgi:hypothetical protein
MAVLMFGELTRGSINFLKRNSTGSAVDYLISQDLRSIVGDVIRKGKLGCWRMGLCGEGLPAAWFSPF